MCTGGSPALVDIGEVGRADVQSLQADEHHHELLPRHRRARRRVPEVVLKIRGTNFSFKTFPWKICIVNKYANVWHLSLIMKSLNVLSPSNGSGWVKLGLHFFSLLCLKDCLEQSTFCA